MCLCVGRVINCLRVHHGISCLYMCVCFFLQSSVVVVVVGGGGVCGCVCVCTPCVCIVYKPSGGLLIETNGLIRFQYSLLYWLLLAIKNTPLLPCFLGKLCPKIISPRKWEHGACSPMHIRVFEWGGGGESN